MRLLRSGEEPAGGASVSLNQLMRLAREWYGDRLDPEWRPRSVGDSQQILDDVGLTGDFWRLP